LTAIGPRDEAWFKALFSDYQTDVWKWLTTHTGCIADAEDLTEDVFTTAWRFRDRVPDERPQAKAWLFGVAKNKLLHYWRARSRRPAWGEFVDVEMTYTATADIAEDVAASVDRKRDTQIMWSVLPLLRPNDQRVLQLHRAGLTATEIADEFGISADAVAKRLRRAKGRLLHLMRTYPAQPDPRQPDIQVRSL